MAGAQTNALSDCPLAKQFPNLAAQGSGAKGRHRPYFVLIDIGQATVRELVPKLIEPSPGLLNVRVEPRQPGTPYSSSTPSWSGLRLWPRTATGKGSRPMMSSVGCCTDCGSRSMNSPTPT